MTNGYSSRIDELDYAYVRTVESTKVRMDFIRLVRSGEGDPPADSFDCEDVFVDVDKNGRIIGLTVTTWKDDPDGKDPSDAGPGRGNGAGPGD